MIFIIQPSTALYIGTVSLKTYKLDQRRRKSLRIKILIGRRDFAPDLISLLHKEFGRKL